jgi:hypothetical protein
MGYTVCPLSIQKTHSLQRSTFRAGPFSSQCIDRRDGLQVFGDIGNIIGPFYFGNKLSPCPPLLRKEGEFFSRI